MGKDSVDLIEIIKTWQGEGPNSGQRILLCRFKSCDRLENKNPCPWCDTIVKMRALEETQAPIENLQKIIKLDSLGLMITGGEPTYGKNLEQTIRLIKELDYTFANIETNGYDVNSLLLKIPKNKSVTVVYSPKFFTEKELHEEINNTKLIIQDPRLVVKLVYDQDNEELLNKFIEVLVDFKYNNKLYIMPKGKTRDEILENAPVCFDISEKYKANFSSRMHIIYNFI